MYTESNKLIAKFMGGKEDFETTILVPPDCIWVPIHGMCKINTIELGKGHILEYHKNWNWLMPVVEKIISDNLSTCRFSSPESCSGQKDWFFSMLDDQTNRQESYANSMQKATYKAVVEFIKWYNEQSK